MSNKRLEDKGQELISVRITRKEFLKLPMETRRRILTEQAEGMVNAKTLSTLQADEGMREKIIRYREDARFSVMKQLEKEYNIKWADICEAVEQIGGQQYSLNVEQFLIEITCQTADSVMDEILALFEAAKLKAVEEVIKEVEGSFSATNYHSPEAGKEPVNSIDVADWQALKSHHL